MSGNNKLTDLKEKLKQALISTFKVIADDFHQIDKNDKNKNSHKYDFLDLDNLNSKADFIPGIHIRVKFFDKCFEFFLNFLPF